LEIDTPFWEIDRGALEIDSPSLEMDTPFFEIDRGALEIDTFSLEIDRYRVAKTHRTP